MNSVVTLFIGGIDGAVTRHDFLLLLESHARVVGLRMLKGLDGSPRGIAFVDLIDSDAAERTRNALDGLKFHGRTLVCRLAERQTYSYKERKNV